ncbi:hypothetical protein TNCV_442411 [Trichonephila clavipes]|nr:hypothetical protein TNCV_442411 [Trichonephila clavipes]
MVANLPKVAANTVIFTKMVVIAKMVTVANMVAKNDANYHQDFARFQLDRHYNSRLGKEDRCVVNCASVTSVV